MSDARRFGGLGAGARIIVIGLIIAAAGWGGWWGVQALGERTLGNVEEHRVEVVASVERRTLEETVAVRGSVLFPKGRPATVADGGRVTSVEVSPGDVIEDGQSVATVDARPIVAVRAEAPFWRPLSAGAQGADVAELQRILASHGHDPGVDDGVFGATTGVALRTWQEQQGISQPDGVLRMNDMVTGYWPRRVGAVAVDVGDFVAPGSELLVLTDLTPRVSIELTPSQRLRVEEGDPVRVEVSATGAVTEGRVVDASLSPITREDGPLAYPATVDLDEQLEVPEGTQVVVTVVMDRAEDVVAAPLAAVVSDADGAPAVRVVRPDGAVEMVPVTLGIAEGAWVEIATGLTGEERVVVVER